MPYLYLICPNCFGWIDTDRDEDGEPFPEATTDGSVYHVICPHCEMRLEITAGLQIEPAPPRGRTA
jgi:hypothetical protein